MTKKKIKARRWKVVRPGYVKYKRRPTKIEVPAGIARKLASSAGRRRGIKMRPESPRARCRRGAKLRPESPRARCRRGAKLRPESPRARARVGAYFAWLWGAMLLSQAKAGGRRVKIHKQKGTGA